MEKKFSVLSQLPKVMKAVLISSLVALPLVVSAQQQSAEALYEEHCQSCHGVDRLGAMGPALFPENLSRLRKNKATKESTAKKSTASILSSTDDIDATSQIKH